MCGHGRNEGPSKWELLGQAAQKLQGEQAKALKQACEQVENQEDEHLYHSMGSSRELWIESFVLSAVLPPPEEKKDVRSAGEPAQAKNTRKQMVGR